MIWTAMSKKNERMIDMLIPDTPQNRKIAEVAATMAIENMYPSKAFIEEIMKVSEGKKL